MDREKSSRLKNVPERFVRSEMHDELIEAEHLARYWWAAELVAGKRVLDAGSGTGYGARLMAEMGAREIVAVDIADDALGEAFSLHPTVHPVRADLGALPFEDGSFDMVVCFEVLEHLDDPSRALDEIARVVASDGFVVVSSPNRSVYPPGNPHHKHEFLPAELHDALKARFSSVELYRQHDWVTSAILDDEVFRADDDSVVLEAALRKVSSGEADAELYTIALAGETALPRPPQQAVLTEAVDLRQLVNDREATVRTVSEQDEHLDALRYRIARMADRQRELRRSLLEAHEQLLRRDEELLEGFLREIEPRDEEIVWLRGVVADHKRRLDALAGSRLWRMAGRYYRYRDGFKRRLHRLKR